MATNYTYTTNIPLSTNTPAQDQPNMQTNTNSINSIVGTDHLTFGTATGSLTDGMHTVIHLADNGGSTPSKVNGSGILWNNTVTFNGNTDEALFFRGNTGGSANITQITAPFGFSASSNGFVFIPGGILMQWGTGSFGGHNFANITFSVSPFPSNVYSIVLTGTSANNTYFIGAFDKNGFTANVIGGNNSNGSFFWIAVGS